MNFDAEFQTLMRFVDLAITILKHAPKSYAQNDGSDSTPVKVR